MKNAKFNYKRYLASREWAVKRRAVQDRTEAGSYCERCDGRGEGIVAAVHHLTYERIGHEDLDDLQGVCGPCHEFLSGTSELDPVFLHLRNHARLQWLASEVAYRRSSYLAANAELWAARAIAWSETTPKPASYMEWFQGEEDPQIEALVTTAADRHSHWLLVDADARGEGVDGAT